MIFIENGMELFVQRVLENEGQEWGGGGGLHNLFLRSNCRLEIYSPLWWPMFGHLGAQPRATVKTIDLLFAEQ